MFLYYFCNRKCWITVSRSVDNKDHLGNHSHKPLDNLAAGNSQHWILHSWLSLNMELMLIKLEWSHFDRWFCNQSAFYLQKLLQFFLLQWLSSLYLFLGHRLAIFMSQLRRCHQLNSDAVIMRNFPSKQCLALPVSHNLRYHGKNLCGQQLA